MSARPSVPTSRRTFLARLDPILVLRLMNDEPVPIRADATFKQYETLYQELREAYLQQHGDTTVNIAALLDQIDNCLVEWAFREAGFVVGFEVCRHLLLGELDLDALKASGDEDEGGEDEGGAR
jgi:hypothetical protein